MPPPRLRAMLSKFWCQSLVSVLSVVVQGPCLPLARAAFGRSRSITPCALPLFLFLALSLSGKYTRPPLLHVFLEVFLFFLPLAKDLLFRKWVPSCRSPRECPSWRPPRPELILHPLPCPPVCVVALAAPVTKVVPPIPVARPVPVAFPVPIAAPGPVAPLAHVVPLVPLVFPVSLPPWAPLVVAVPLAPLAPAAPLSLSRGFGLEPGAAGPRPEAWS